MGADGFLRGKKSRSATSPLGGLDTTHLTSKTKKRACFKGCVTKVATSEEHQHVLSCEPGPEDFMRLLESLSPGRKAKLRQGYGENGRGLFLTEPVGQQLTFGGESEIGQWLAACRGEKPPGDSSYTDPKAALLSLPLEALLWVSEKAPYSFTAAARESEELVTFLQRENVPWDQKLVSLLLWATRAGTPDDLSTELPDPDCYQDGEAGPLRALWQRYVHFLPTTEQLSHLVCFEASDRAALQDEQMASASERLQTQLDDFYQTNFAPGRLLQGLGCSKETVRWAVAAVGTRAFSVEVSPVSAAPSLDGRGGRQNVVTISALAPACDLLNYSVDASTHFAITDNNRFEISLHSCADAGAEALLCYMEKASNHKLMSVFGFTVPGNPYDTVRFLPPAVLPGGGVCKEAVMTHMGLQELSALRDVTFIDSNAAEKQSPAHRERVISVFKSLPFRSEGGGTPASFIEPLCDSDDTTVAAVFQDEAAAVRRAMEDCQSRLDDLPTTLEEDELLLADITITPLSACTFAAVQYRAEKKRLLHAAVEVLEGYLRSARFSGTRLEELRE